MSGSLLVEGATVLVATGFVWVGSSGLEETSKTLSAYYGLPMVVQGAIVAAIGSSFPELASVVFAALKGSFGLGVGAIVGSAIFNILVIPALTGVATDDDINSSRTLVYKEAQFYMLAVSVMIITFAFAIIYFPTPNTLEGSVTRPLALMPLLLYGLYVFIQWQDVSEHDGGERPTDVNVLKQWAKLAVSLLVILVAIERMIHSVQIIGNAFGTPDFLWGITVVAAGTSLPDTLVSVRAARDGRGVAGLANVLGSNTFDLLVAIPLGVLITGQAIIDFAIAVPMLGVLTLATVLLFTVLRTDLKLSDYEAYTLLLAYLVFVTLMIAETVAVVDIVPGI